VQHEIRDARPAPGVLTPACGHHQEMLRDGPNYFLIGCGSGKGRCSPGIPEAIRFDRVPGAVWSCFINPYAAAFIIARGGRTKKPF